MTELAIGVSLLLLSVKLDDFLPAWFPFAATFLPVWCFHGAALTGCLQGVLAFARWLRRAHSLHIPIRWRFRNALLEKKRNRFTLFIPYGIISCTYKVELEGDDAGGIGKDAKKGLYSLKLWKVTHFQRVVTIFVLMVTGTIALTIIFFAEIYACYQLSFAKLIQVNGSRAQTGNDTIEQRNYTSYLNRNDSLRYLTINPLQFSSTFNQTPNSSDTNITFIQEFPVPWFPIPTSIFVVTLICLTNANIWFYFHVKETVCLAFIFNY